MSDVNELRKQGNNDTADLPEGFKMTELGPLPEDWEVVRLHHIFVPVNKKERLIRVQADQIYRTLTVKLYGKGIILREEIEGGKIGTPTLYRTKAYDFVFSKIDARNGAWGFVPEELDGGLVSGDFPILQLIDTIADRDFINFSLSRPNIWEQLRNIAVGTTNRRRIQVPQLLQFPIPLPPLPEQRTIAYVLRTVQRAKDTTERVIQATRELKKSLMHYLFTYGPVPFDEAKKVPLKETEIGLIPEHWEVVRLGKVVQKSFGGGTPSTNVAEYWGGDIPWTTSAIIGEDDVFLYRYQRTITQLGLSNSSAKLAPRESVIIGTRVGVGKAVLTVFDIAISQDLTALILNKESVEPLFLVYLFKSSCLKQQIHDRIRGTTIKGIPRRDLLDILIPLPLLPEQREIAHILGVIDKKLQAEETRKQALDALFKTLLHNLMTGKIQVKDLLSEIEEKLNPCDSEQTREIDREAH